MDDSCVFCGQPFSSIVSTVCLQEKGAQAINACSQIRNENISLKSGQTVHQNCRRSYCHPTNIAKVTKSLSDNDINIGCKRRSSEQAFNFKTDCLFCGMYISDNIKKRGTEIHSVVTKSSPKNSFR